MVSRIKQVLPRRWFPDTAPVLDIVLSGPAWAWAWAYNLLQVVKSQTRLATAQGVWLDLVALDYFGGMLTRRLHEQDDSFRVRLRRELVRERATRAAVVSAITDATGRAPIVFEPANTMDTGGYGTLQTSCGLAYGAAGGWGSLALPFQFFVTAHRPASAGIASVCGWGGSVGGYGTGCLEYADLQMLAGRITDVDICTATALVLPAGTVAWLRITS
jgi:hypothetical protein